MVAVGQVCDRCGQGAAVETVECDQGICLSLGLPVSRQPFPSQQSDRNRNPIRRGGLGGSEVSGFAWFWVEGGASLLT